VRVEIALKTKNIVPFALPKRGKKREGSSIEALKPPFEYKVDFSEDWPKLAFPLFTTFRIDRGTYYYRAKRIYAIYVKRIKRGFAQLEAVLSMKLRDIPLPLIRFDTFEQITLQEFYQKLEQWHSKNSHWRSLDTLFLILYLLWVVKL